MAKADIINEFLVFWGDEQKSVYDARINHLAAFGCKPRKLKTQRHVISFHHPSRNNQIAEMGIRLNGEIFFSLRFSACKNHSKSFEDIVAESGDNHEPMCDICGLCGGDKHTYIYADPDGNIINRCGAYAYNIPDISMADAEEIRDLLEEQHEYFIRRAL